MKPTLLILAAGIGSRYSPDKLKQLDGIGSNGESILDYSIYDAVQAGFTKVVLVIREETKNLFEQHLKLVKNFIDIEYVIQSIYDVPSGFDIPLHRKSPWGTAHAILSARKIIHEPFAVINADDFYGRESYESIYKLLNSVDKNSCEYSMIGYRLKNTLSDSGGVNRGICSIDNGLLKTIIEWKDIKLGNDFQLTGLNTSDGLTYQITGNELVSLNLWGFTPTIFEKLGRLFIDFLEDHLYQDKAEFFLPSVVNDLISNDQITVNALSSDELWFGVTYLEDKKMVMLNIGNLIENSVYPKKLWGT